MKSIAEILNNAASLSSVSALPETPEKKGIPTTHPHTKKTAKTANTPKTAHRSRRPQGSLWLWIVMMLFLTGIGLLLSMHGWASGSDVLQGTTDDATTTIQHSGKKWVYLIEGITALGAYIKTKNIFVLGGVAVVAVFLNIVLRLASA